MVPAEGGICEEWEPLDKGRPISTGAEPGDNGVVEVSGKKKKKNQKVVLRRLTKAICHRTKGQGPLEVGAGDAHQARKLSREPATLF